MFSDSEEGEREEKRRDLHESETGRDVLDGGEERTLKSVLLLVHLSKSRRSSGRKFARDGRGGGHI